MKKNGSLLFGLLIMLGGGLHAQYLYPNTSEDFLCESKEILSNGTEVPAANKQVVVTNQSVYLGFLDDHQHMGRPPGTLSSPRDTTGGADPHKVMGITDGSGHLLFTLHASRFTGGEGLVCSVVGGKYEEHEVVEVAATPGLTMDFATLIPLGYTLQTNGDGEHLNYTYLHKTLALRLPGVFFAIAYKYQNTRFVISWLSLEKLGVYDHALYPWMTPPWGDHSVGLEFTVTLTNASPIVIGRPRITSIEFQEEMGQVGCIATPNSVPNQFEVFCTPYISSVPTPTPPYAKQ